MELRIDHVHAVAVDFDKSIEFYGKLGFGGASSSARLMPVARLRTSDMAIR